MKLTSIHFALAAIFVISSPLHAAPGDLEALNLTTIGEVRTSAVQPDGKLIIAGDFTSVQGVPRNRIARLNANGTLDMGFDPNADSYVLSVSVQADGKVLLAGGFLHLRPNGAASPTVRNYIARVNADGTLDASFDPNATNDIYAIALQADGKVLFGGSFTMVQPNGAASPTVRNGIARVNADGTLDAGFDPNVGGIPGGGVYGMALQANGQVVLCGAFTALQANGAATATTRNYVARVNADGSLDTGFDPNPNQIIYNVVVQAGGKVLLAGGFTTLQPNGTATATTRNYLARVNADGTLDTGFDPNPNTAVESLAVQADGKVVLGGDFTTLQPNGAATATTRICLARVNADGTLDAGFDPNPSGYVGNVALLANGQIFISGGFTSLQPNGAATATARGGMARLLNDAATQTLSATSASRIEWLRGGSAPETQQVSFELSTDSGVTYTALGSGTRISGGWELTGLSLPALGQIRARARTVGGYSNGSEGLVQAVAPTSGLGAPEIVVSGNNAIITNGDTTPSTSDHTDFGPVIAVFGSSVRTFTIENSGSGNLTLGTLTISGVNAADFIVSVPPTSLVAAGDSASFQVTFDPFAVGTRTATLSFTTNDSDENPFTFSLQGQAEVATPGTLDSLAVTLTAPIGEGIPSYVNATATQPDGKIILVGNFESVNGVARGHIARLNVDGTLDASFDPNANKEVLCVAVQADGKILIGGNFITLSPNGDVPTARNRIARVNADGTLDMSFDPKASSTVNCIVVQPDDKVLLGGTFTTFQPNGAASTTARNRIARLNADGTLDPVFNPKANSTVNSIALQTDGKVLLGGIFLNLQPNGAASSTARSRIARVNADGTLDATFDPTANLAVNSIAVQADGKVLLGGIFTALAPNGGASTARSRIARVNADGTLDTGFDPTANTTVLSIAVQTDGQILLGGAFTTLQPNGATSATTRNFIARVNADGTLDTGFNPNANILVSSVAVQPDGKVVIAGNFTTLQPNGALTATLRVGLARLKNDAATQTLNVASAARIEWLRGGTSPQTQLVSFEQSTDGGTTYTPLGSATRITGGWELTGLSLSGSGIIRARARTDGGRFSGSSGIMESLQSFSLSVVTDADHDGLLDTWEITHFGTTTAHTATDDSDHDGLVELLEEAFGLNPNLADTAPQPIILNGYLTATITRQPGVAYEVQTAADLANASFSASTTTVLINNAITLQVRDNFTTGTGARFMRISVTPAP